MTCIITENAGETRPDSSGSEITIDIYGNRLFEFLFILLIPFFASGIIFFSGQFMMLLLVVSIILLPWLALPIFRLKSKQTRINSEGISRGKVFIPWNEIKEITTGTMRSPGLFVKFGDKKRHLWLPSCPEVYKQILPRIEAECPGVTVSGKVRSVQAAPENLSKIPRWVGIVLAVAGLLLFAFVAFAYSCEFSPINMLIGFAILMGIYLLVHSNIEPKCTTEQRFIYGVVMCLFLSALNIITQMICLSMHMFALMYSVVGIYLLASAAMAMFRLRLKGWISTAVIAAVAIAAWWFFAGEVEGLRRLDVTSQLGKGRHMLPFFWSSDGKYFAPPFVDGKMAEEQNLIELADLKSHPLPLHDGYQMIWGIDGRIVVRTVSQKDQKYLFIYYIADGREIEASTVKNKRFFIGYLTGQSISPGGDYVCWLERASEQVDPPVLKVFDTATSSSREIPVSWPDEKEIKWNSCGWLGRDKIAVLGNNILRECGGDGKLHILHMLTVKYPEGTTEHWNSKKPMTKWTVSPDFKYAFAQTPREGNSEKAVVFVELATGREIQLPDGPVPQWTRDSQKAFRLTDVSGSGYSLCRFDVATGAETPILKIPDDSELVSLSPQGHYAILQLKGVRICPLSIVYLDTGGRRRLDIPMLASYFAFGFGGDFPRDFPWLSVWSNDEKYFLVQLMDFPNKNFRTFIYRMKN